MPLKLQIARKCVARLLVFSLALVKAVEAEPGPWVAVPLDESSRYFRNPQDVRAIHFCDVNHGVCGGSGLWKTSDGGFTWKAVPIPKIRNPKTNKEGHGWRYVRMVTPLDIWAFGQLYPGGTDQTKLLRSTDGGLTWQDVPTGQLDHVGPLCFEGPTWWILCENGNRAYVSRNQGQTWKSVDWGGNERRVFHLCFPTERVGFAVGGQRNGGRVWKSTDGGKTWLPSLLPDTVPFLRRCSFITEDKGWIGGNQGQVWHTHDGGQTWKNCGAPFLRNQKITGIKFFESGEGFVCADVPYGKQSVSRLTADLAIAYSPDQGVTWKPAASGFKAINEMYFLDREHAWACARNRGETPGPLLFLYER